MFLFEIFITVPSVGYRLEGEVRRAVAVCERPLEGMCTTTVHRVFSPSNTCEMKRNLRSLSLALQRPRHCNIRVRKTDHGSHTVAPVLSDIGHPRPRMHRCAPLPAPPLAELPRSTATLHLPLTFAC